MKRNFAAGALAGFGMLLIMPSATVGATVTYDDVAPLLAERCVMCHSGPAAAAGLRLDTLEGALAGSAKGKVVQPGDAASSELIRRLKGSSQPRMPMTGPPFLSDAEVARFEQWIAGGLAAGRGAASSCRLPATMSASRGGWTHRAKWWPSGCVAVENTLASSSVPAPWMGPCQCGAPGYRQNSDV